MVREKTNKKNFTFHTMKNFSIEIYEKALSKLRLSDYEKFSVQQSLL